MLNGQIENVSDAVMKTVKRSLINKEVGDYS